MNALVNNDASLDQALDRAIARLREWPHHNETLAALRGARSLAASGAEPSPESVATLGPGWVAEEALAIGVYCALVARDFEHGVLLAVNHSGDSDSMGAITGNVLRAIHGHTGIPSRWIDHLECDDIQSNASATTGSPSCSPSPDPIWRRTPPGGSATRDGEPAIEASSQPSYHRRHSGCRTWRRRSSLPDLDSNQD